MTYLYLSKIEDHYYIMNSSEIHDFNDPSSNYDLLCKLDLTYDELSSKAGGLYGKIAEQAIELNVLLKGCRDFKREETNIKLNEILSHYLASIDQIELATLDIQVKEAENYISSKGSYNSTILKSLAAARSINLDELVLNILDKVKEHVLKLIGFKCLKDHIEIKLETVSSLEGFEHFNIENEIANYQSFAVVEEVAEADLKLPVFQESVEYIKETEAMKPAAKEKKKDKLNKKEAIKIIKKSEALDILDGLDTSSSRNNI